MSDSTVRDQFGCVISVGDYLAYPVCVGRSAGIDVGKVIEVRAGGGKPLKVLGTSFRYGTDGTKPKSKPSFLSYPERCVRLPPAMVPRPVLEALG